MAQTKKLLSQKEIYALRMARWKARTDLGFLCREVLGYKDVDDEVHGPVLDILQKFPRPDSKQFEDNDQWTGKTWAYKPLMPMPSLPADRRVLILDPRSHLKTTINAQAHTIQWILNYPDVAVAVWQSNLEKATLILREIKNHFQNNKIFRRLFPEHCPQTITDIRNFGTVVEFTTKARSSQTVRGVPTVMTLSIDKGTAGLHFDVMKFSDIVEPENVKTRERMQSVIDSFYIAENLLVAPRYWIDVEGTRYAFGDLYGQLIKQWMEEHVRSQPHKYRVHVRSVYKRLYEGKIQTIFTPNTLDDDNYPFAKTETGEMIPWWPKDASGQIRFTYADLEAERKNSPYIFSSQKENNPRGGIEGREIFAVGKSLPLKIKRENFRRNIRVAYRTITVDTAETNNARSNYTAIVVMAWDGFGRAWVEDIIHGKFLPDETITQILEAARKYKPREIKIEKTSFVRGLETGLRRDMDLSGEYWNITFLDRDTQIAKTERIQNTLHSPYTKGQLRFVVPNEGDERGLATWEHLITELKTFPLGETDDILDALADQFQGKEWFGRENARPTPVQENEYQTDVFLGIEDPFDPATGYYTSNPNNSEPFYARTGGL